MAENFLKKEEELTHFRREDIKTMDKDIAVIRDREARIEREKIIQLNRLQTKPKQGIEDITVKPPEELPIEQSTEQEPPKTLKKKNYSKKFIVRGFIALAFIALIFYATKLPWDKIKNYFVELIETEEVQPELPPDEEPEKPAEFIAPVSLVAVQSTIISEVDNKEETANILRQTLNQEVPQDSLNQIVLKYVPENRALKLDEIPLISIFGTELLPEIYPKLGDDYTLALYSQTQGPRAVFIGKVKDSQDLIILFNSWETEILNGNIVIGQENIQPLNPYFKTSFYKNVGLRYLTLSKDDLGICYAYFEDYFVISSSFDGFKKAIDNIQLTKVD
jgi:hypothetical protein